MNASAFDTSRLSMSLSEAIFTQRAIRKFRPDPIPVADLRLIIEAAVGRPMAAISRSGASSSSPTAP